MTQRSRPKLHKLLFVLPNLFTISSIFCGFSAIVLSTGGASSEVLYKAALLIFFASFFDAFDGRVARMTKTQSEFGVQLDSLADLVSFGVAPGLLAYRWGLAPLGTAGVLAAFVFPAAGALRLARFNVAAAQEQAAGSNGATRFFTGLPVPLAAGTLISLVIAHHKAIGGEVVHHGWVAALVVGLGLLMVSNVRYRTFKDLRFNLKSGLAFALVLSLGLVVSLTYRASFALVGYFALYIGAGLATELWRLIGRARPGDDDAPPEEAAGDEEDEAEALSPAEEDEEVYST